MSFIPRPHEIYKHFEGNLYQVTAIAEHTQTGEQLVVYQALYGDFKSFAAPPALFTERMDKGKYPGLEQEFLFELQGPDAGRQREDGGGLEDAPARREQVSGAERMDAAAVQPAEEDGEEAALDPFVLEFLDADSYEQRLNILAGIHHRITDDMITTMAIACDIEINDGDTEERYEALKACLLTLERYECNRLR